MTLFGGHVGLVLAPAKTFPPTVVAAAAALGGGGAAWRLLCSAEEMFSSPEESTEAGRSWPAEAGPLPALLACMGIALGGPSLGGAEFLMKYS